MSGAEAAPAGLTDSASTDDPRRIRGICKTRSTKKTDNCCKLDCFCTSVATSDCAEGYSSVASLVMQRYAFIRLEEFVDGGSAVRALQEKFRANGAFRMQELYNQSSSLQVTAADDRQQL